MAAPQTPSCSEPISAGTATLAGWDPLCETQEGLALWFAACNAWGRYVCDIALASGPVAVVDAQTRLFADCLDLCGQAMASRLKDAGVTAPLLNDA